MSRNFLEKMTVTPHPLTVSGFSSGASMAMQLHISSSGRYDGVGAFSGGNTDRKS